MSNDFNPYSQFGEQTPRFGEPGPPPPRNSRLWVSIIVAVVLLLGGGAGACCCGSMFFVKGAFEDDALLALESSPAVRQELGEIESVTFNVVATGEYEEYEIEVYDVVGSKQSAVFTAWFDGDHEFLHGKLDLDSGEALLLAP